MGRPVLAERLIVALADGSLREHAASGEFLASASCQADKTTTRRHQARQSRAYDRPWNLYKADEAVRAVV